MKTARDRWLDEGVKVLAEEGPGGIRIDRIAARLGLSKGSFHHHFDGAAGFKQALLTHLQHLQTESLSRASAELLAEREKRARVGFTDLISLLSSPHGELYRPQLETALRAWALTDPDAARTQQAIDEARLELLRDIWRRIATDEEDARIAALLPYVIAVGSSVIIPPVGIDDLRRLFERILPLVPEDAILDRSETDQATGTRSDR